MKPRWRLTARQRDLVRLACDGLTDKEIASRLGIRYRTVRTHMEAIYRALHVTTRAGLVGRWLRDDWH